MTRRSGTTTGRTWLAGVGIGILAVSVVAISAAALEHAGRKAPTGTAATVEPFHLGVQSPTATPTSPPEVEAPAPEPSGGAGPTPAVTAGSRADERVIAVGSVAVWRATAGECGGPAPRLERSADGGASWSDVTPLYTGTQRIVGIDVAGASDAVIVVGTGPDCGAQALRSFTRGQFWDPAPAALSTWSFVSPGDASTVTTPTGAMAAPCADARGLSSRNGTAAVLCDGVGNLLDSSGQWVTLPVPDAVAVAVADDGVLVAHIADSCTGLAVSRVPAGSTTAEPVGCVADASQTAPVALAEDDGGVVVWAGDVWERLA